MKHTLMETAKTSGDVTAGVVTVGTLAQVLPSIAALFTIIWTAIRIYETHTVQKIINHFARKADK